MMTTPRTTGKPAGGLHLPRYLPLGLTLLIGPALSVLAFWAACRAEAKRLQDGFDRQACHLAHTIEDQVAECAEIVQSIAAFYSASREVERTEFAQFADQMIATYPAITMLAWAPCVPAGERRAFAEYARTQGELEFKITERTGNGQLAAASPRADYFPVSYIVALAGHAGDVGLDLASDPEYWAAMQTTLGQGGGSATAPTAVVHEDDRPLEVRFLMPIYGYGRAPGFQKRPGELSGFVLAVFFVGKLAEEAFADQETDGMTIILCDRATPDGRHLLYRQGQEGAAGSAPRPGRVSPEPKACPVAWCNTPDHLDHDWTLECRPGLDYTAGVQSWPAWAMLTGGLLLTSLLSIYLARATAEHTRSEHLVALRTAELSAANTTLVGEIAERRRVEAELRESEERHRAITETAQDAILTADADGNIRFWNCAAEKAFGFSAAEAVGKNMMALIVPARYHEAKRKGLAEFGRTGRGPVIGKTLELTALRKDGTEFPTEMSVSGYRDPEGFRGVALIRDVTDRKHAERELEETKEAAERANRAKSEFLANMSHEIRTPMTAILGFADLLLEDGNLHDAPPERIEAAKAVKSNGQHLLTIINDILDLSKIEVGKMVVELIPCSPCRIVAELASLMKVRADAKGLALHTEYVGAVPETIRTDPTRLRQILVNVIANAIKFTEVGAVRLVTRLIIEGEEPLMQFDVVDTGIGITAEQVVGLFQPFAQADASTTRRFGGTGLGLAISKRLAGMLGGDVVVLETQPGLGTRFRITVATGPLEGVGMIEDPSSATTITREATATTAGSEVSDLNGCRILLAEDGPDNQRLISHVLKKAGATVTVVANGKEAVDAALAAREKGSPFDGILMDMQMPVMDGYDATRLLRENHYTAPIIALTAHAMEGDRERCVEAGCDDYASKPIDRHKLIEMIRKHLYAAVVS
jgi:PAS domain S-box-containing protein